MIKEINELRREIRSLRGRVATMSGNTVPGANQGTGTGGVSARNRPNSPPGLSAEAADGLRKELDIQR